MSSKRVLDAVHIPLVGVLAFALLVAFQVNVPTQLDFGQLYRSVLALARGEHLYQVSDADIVRYSSQSSFNGALPFPGPPWYVALAYPLHIFSPETAAKLWMALSLATLCGTIKLATPNLSLRAQAVAFILAIISAPVQGHLIVGQFTLPALLGIALTLAGIREGSSTKSAIGLSLTTFRPHFGLPFAGGVVAWLLVTQRRHGLRVCATFLLIMTLFVALSLAIDPQSIARYPEYLRLLNNFPSNKLCDTCSSIPVLVERMYDSPEEVWRVRFLAGASVGIPLAGLLFLVRRSPEFFIAGMTCAVMLAAPYIRNYDYVLLVVPFCIEVKGFLSGSHLRGTIVGLVMMTAYTIAGLVPYISSRTLQGELLIAAPALIYLSCYLLCSRTDHSVASCSTAPHRSSPSPH